jgi:tRNA1Val (adenine37-N6)-methyltransferase
MTSSPPVDPGEPNDPAHDDPYAELDALLEGEALSDDAIAGTYRVLQRVRGHRYSLDDLATAYEAARAAPGARRVLDLGCGLGSVLTMLAWKLPDARLVGVEAQAISLALVRRNVRRNALTPRVALVHGDLRDAAVLDRARALGGPFELVTGTPPYMPPGTATPSPDSQRAHARVELRGGVEDYAQAVARVLAPGGTALLCADARTPERATQGAQRAGLVCVAQRDVIPRAGTKGALFSVFTLRHAADAPGSDVMRIPPLVVRDAHGARTEAAHALRRFFDLPVDESEPASP